MRGVAHQILDGVPLAVLREIKELTEIRDASGKVVGFFAPASSERADLLARAAARIDPEEIERRRAEGPGHTTREVFEHLKSLTQDEQSRAYLQSKIDRLVERDGCSTP